jgi:hypothetical protein
MMNQFFKEDVYKYLVVGSKVNNLNIINKRDYLMVKADVEISGKWNRITGEGAGTVSAFINGFKLATDLDYDFFDTHETMVVIDGVNKVCIYVIVVDNNGSYQYATYIGDNAVVGLFECYVDCVNRFIG